MKQRFETLTIHGGHEPDPTTHARAVPVCRSTSFTFRDAQHAADIFSLKEPGYFYSRVSNPTQAVLEERLAMLESCGLPPSDFSAGSLALSSGTSAVFYAVINLARQGDEIVAASNLYGGTYTMFDQILPQFGIVTRMVKNNDLDAMAAAIHKGIHERTEGMVAVNIGMAAVAPGQAPRPRFELAREASRRAADADEPTSWAD